MGKTNSIKLAALLVLTIGLSACGDKKDQSQQVSVRGPDPRAAMSAAQAANVNVPGRITADPTYQQEFQLAVTDFLSASIRPDYVGFVSASGQNNSGVFFGGVVNFTNGSLRNGLGASLTVAPNSKIVLQIRDYVQQYPNAPALPPTALGNGQGTVTGTDVQLQFSDQFGTVQLTGTLDTARNMFYGSISYDNNVMYDGTRPGHAGTLGDFQIPICSFFNCN